jgi:hypothetical protein
MLLWTNLGERGMAHLDQNRPWCREVAMKAFAIDSAFREAGGTYDSEGNPMRPAWEENNG